MTVEIGLCLIAAAVPITSLVLRFSGCVSPVQFVRLETEFHDFKEEVVRRLKEISKKLEK